MPGRGELSMADLLYRRASFHRAEGAFVRPCDRRIYRYDAARREDAETGSAALLEAYRRYFERRDAR